MGNLAQRLVRRFPWFNPRRLAVDLFATALLIVFLFPDAHRVAQFVTIASVIGAAAAILCGLTFWPTARVRVARFLNAENLKFRYKVVRRYAATAALVGLSFWFVGQAAFRKTDAAKALNDSGLAYRDKGEHDRAVQGDDGQVWPMFHHDLSHSGVSQFNTSSDTGTLKWKFQTNGRVDSSLAVGQDGTTYVGSGDHNLYAVNPDGTLKWRFATGDVVVSSPAIGKDGTIYVGSSDHNLYAVNPDGHDKVAVSDRRPR